MPPLTLTPKISPKQAGTPQSQLTRTESIRVAAGEHPRASTGRPSAVATASASKPVVNRSGSASKAKSKTTATKHLEADSSSAPSGTEDVVVVSGRSKRNAATKATQRLHNEIMPDVMNYQQEMRGKGKGRKSFGEEGEVQTNGRGRQKRVSDGGEEDEGGDKKRRRVSAASTKGKAPATEEEDEDEDAKVVKSGGKAKGKTVRLAVTESEDSDVQIVSKDGGKAKKGKEKAKDVDSRSVIPVTPLFYSSGVTDNIVHVVPENRALLG